MSKPCKTSSLLSTTDMMTDEEKERQRQIQEAEAEAAKLEQQRLAQEAALNEQIARDQEKKLKDAFVNNDIYFDYDRWDLSDEAKAALNEKASYMLSHPELRVIVEGHCDERGSNSYNMALGEKRARAAAAYLEVMGISPERMGVGQLRGRAAQGDGTYRRGLRTEPPGVFRD